MNAVQYYKKYSQAELVALGEEVRSNPKNRMPPGSFWLYTPNARKKINAIDAAISYHLRDKIVATGGTINDAGYTGQQTKK